jgi:hypothetical protein
MMGGRQMGDQIRLEEVIPIVQQQRVLQNKPGESIQLQQYRVCAAGHGY